MTLTSGPVDTVSAPQNWLVEIAWTASDPDGHVDYFEYATDPPSLKRTLFAAADTEWVRTRERSATIRFRASRPDSLGWGATASESHVFVLRAVDDRGAASALLVRAFYAYTVAPNVEIISPEPHAFLNAPVPLPFRVSWAGHDPDGAGSRQPASYRTRLLDLDEPGNRAFLVDPDSLIRLGFASNWAEWRALDADTTSQMLTSRDGSFPGGTGSSPWWPWTRPGPRPRTHCSTGTCSGSTCSMAPITARGSTSPRRWWTPRMRHPVTRTSPSARSRSSSPRGTCRSSAGRASRPRGEPSPPRAGSWTETPSSRHPRSWPGAPRTGARWARRATGSSPRRSFPAAIASTSRSATTSGTGAWASCGSRCSSRASRRSCSSWTTPDASPTSSSTTRRGACPTSTRNPGRALRSWTRSSTRAAGSRGAGRATRRMRSPCRGCSRGSRSTRSARVEASRIRHGRRRSRRSRDTVTCSGSWSRLRREPSSPRPPPCEPCPPRDREHAGRLRAGRRPGVARGWGRCLRVAHQLESVR